MREIKFRYWTGYRMIQVHRLTFNDDEFIVEGEGVVHYANAKSLMQFTGLHDENGREIYEGDILRWDWVSQFEEIPSTTEYHEVFWNDGTFWTRQCADDVDCTLEEIADQAIVIGNIYENPELLEVDASDAG